MRDFRKLLVWQKSHQLALDIYRTTGQFPKEELYGLTIQLRRASASVPTNIAEGCGRNTTPDFCRFLIISMGSASEVEYLLLLSKDLGYITDETYFTLNKELTETKRMMNTFIQKLK